MTTKGRLLVVTSDPMVRMLLGNYLSGLGYDAKVAADSLEVLGHLERWQPELVVNQRIEHTEPSIVALLEQTSVKAPVVVFAPEDCLAAGGAEGASVSLLWPVSRPEIASIVEKVLARTRAERLSNPPEIADRDTIPAPQPIDDTNLGPAQKIGRYEVELLIGRGAMGEVYRCYDELTDRVVAIKTIRMLFESAAMDSDPNVDRFRVEAAALARLLHPRIVSTYQFGVDDKRGEMFLVMQYVDGPSLRFLMNRGAVPIREALQIGWDLADALAHAHERGVVHRDIKPENVLINDLGQPMLTDFGLARLGNFSVSDGQAIAGTPNYMAPEQILSPRDVDGRTDQYGLGALLHEVITGAPCIEDDGQPATILSRLYVRRPSLKECGVEATDSLDALIGKMLAQESGERFQTDEELLTAFEEVGEELGLAFTRY